MGKENGVRRAGILKFTIQKRNYILCPCGKKNSKTLTLELRVTKNILFKFENVHRIKSNLCQTDAKIFPDRFDCNIQMTENPMAFFIGTCLLLNQNTLMVNICKRDCTPAQKIKLDEKHFNSVWLLLVTTCLYLIHAKF
jgi:hypothetical protein